MKCPTFHVPNRSAKAPHIPLGQVKSTSNKYPSDKVDLGIVRAKELDTNVCTISVSKSGKRVSSSPSCCCSFPNIFRTRNRILQRFERTVTSDLLGPNSRGDRFFVLKRACSRRRYAETFRISLKAKEKRVDRYNKPFYSTKRSIWKQFY